MAKPKESAPFLVVATTEQRFYLADMLLSDAVKVKGREADTQLWRAREALGLFEITQRLTHGKGVVAAKPLREPIANAFLVTAERAEFILAQREKVELRTGVSGILRPLIEQLAARTDEPGAENVPPFDEATDSPLWAPPEETEPPPDDAS